MLYFMIDFDNSAKGFVILVVDFVVEFLVRLRVLNLSF
jgi:hypothetical protein